MKGSIYNGSNRVKRGGSWNNNANNIRSANRNNNNPSNRNNNIGFRLANTFSIPILYLHGHNGERIKSPVYFPALKIFETKSKREPEVSTIWKTFGFHFVLILKKHLISKKNNMRNYHRRNDEKY